MAGQRQVRRVVLHRRHQRNPKTVSNSPGREVLHPVGAGEGEHVARPVVDLLYLDRDAPAPDQPWSRVPVHGFAHVSNLSPFSGLFHKHPENTGTMQARRASLFVEHAGIFAPSSVRGARSGRSAGADGGPATRNLPLGICPSAFVIALPRLIPPDGTPHLHRNRR